MWARKSLSTVLIKCDLLFVIENRNERGFRGKCTDGSTVRLSKTSTPVHKLGPIRIPCDLESVSMAWHHHDNLRYLKVSCYHLGSHRDGQNLDCYTVLAWYGMIRVWSGYDPGYDNGLHRPFMIGRSNIGWDYLVSQCIVGSRDRWEFPPCFGGRRQSPCTALTTSNACR